MKQLLIKLVDEIVKNRWIQLLVIIFTIVPASISLLQSQSTWVTSLAAAAGFIAGILITFAIGGIKTMRSFDQGKALQALEKLSTLGPAKLLVNKGKEVVFVVGGAERDYAEASTEEAARILKAFYGLEKHRFASMTDCFALGRLVEAIIKACKDITFDYRLAVDVIADDSFKKEHNFITIGAGDSNPFTCQVQLQFEKQFHTRLPIYFDPASTSHELVVAYVEPKRRYNEQEAQHYNYGLLALIPNPWNPDKIIIIAAGLHREGTQAAVNYLAHNINHPIQNKVWPQFPVIVVQPEAVRKIGARNEAVGACQID